MCDSKIWLKAPDFVLKTKLKTGTRSLMKGRYASCIIAVIEGSVDFIGESTTVTVGKNDAVFIPENYKYEYKVTQSAVSLIFNFHTVEPLCDIRFLGRIDPEKTVEIFDKISNLSKSPDNFFYELLSLFYKLLSVFFDNNPVKSSTEIIVEKAEKTVADCFHKSDFNCKSLANELHLSEPYIRKLFVRYKNIPCRDYIKKVRMEKARQYILEGFSVSEAAVNVGYSDVYQFSRAYKKHFGFSPSKTLKN